jgi:hypothetical protein
MAGEPEQKDLTISTVINACTRDNWYTAWTWLAYTFFYWMLPTLIVIASLSVGKQKINATELLIHGEFLIYAITITASSTRLLSKDLPQRQPFVNRQVFNLVSHVLIFPAICIYGIVRYIAATGTTEALNKPLIVWYSGILLAVSFAFSFFMFLFDAQRTSPDTLRAQIADKLAHSSDKLTADFDVIQGRPPDPNPPLEVAPSEEAVEQEHVDLTHELGENLDAVQDDK